MADGVAHGYEDQFDHLWEIAKDAGIAAIDGERYGLDHYVFVPQKRWDNALDNYSDGWRERCKGTALTWNQFAEWHRCGL